MKYQKQLEDKRVSQTMRLLDRFGKEIPNVLEWDSETGIAIVLEHQNPNDVNSAMVEKQKFYPSEFATGMIVDDTHKPNEEQLADIRMRKTGKREREN